MVKNLAPVVLFTYNRLNKTMSTIDSLKKNNLSKNTLLYVFSDGPKKGQEDKVNLVRKFLRSIKGFKKVIIYERKNNYGLANSIITGVTEILKKHSCVIVIEDDLLLSDKFLNYMNSALNFYEDYPAVFSISGYSPEIKSVPAWYEYDVYFNPVSSSWGWATWKSRWDNAYWEGPEYDLFFKSDYLKAKFDRMGGWLSKMLASQFKGEINSWAIRWAFSHFKHNAYAVFPIRTFVSNEGLDGSGVHCKGGENLKVKKMSSADKYKFSPIIFEEELFLKNYKRAYAKKITLAKVGRVIKENLLKLLN